MKRSNIRHCILHGCLNVTEVSSQKPVQFMREFMGKNLWEISVTKTGFINGSFASVSCVEIITEKVWWTWGAALQGKCVVPQSSKMPPRTLSPTKFMFSSFGEMCRFLRTHAKQKYSFLLVSEKEKLFLCTNKSRRGELSNKKGKGRFSKGKANM